MAVPVVAFLVVAGFSTLLVAGFSSSVLFLRRLSCLWLVPLRASLFLGAIFSCRQEDTIFQEMTVLIATRHSGCLKYDQYCFVLCTDQQCTLSHNICVVVQCDIPASKAELKACRFATAHIAAFNAFQPLALELLVLVPEALRLLQNHNTLPCLVIRY